MSQENVDAVLTVFRSFRGREDAPIFDLYDPDVEWNMEGYPAWPGQTTYRGVEGVQTFFRDWLHDFAEYEATAIDPVDLGDRVVVTVYDRAHGKGSGVPIERYHAQAWIFRDGRVVRIEVWDSRESALAAHGASDDVGG